MLEHQLLVFMHTKPRKLRSKNSDNVHSFLPQNASSRVICDDGASSRIAAKAGIGICMSSTWNIHTDLVDSSLVRMLPDYQIENESAVWLIYPKSNVLTPKARVFIDHLIAKIGGLPH